MEVALAWWWRAWRNARPMGDFVVDTAVEGADGRYGARISRDWEIWGPNGGYVAARGEPRPSARLWLHRPEPRPDRAQFHRLDPTSEWLFAEATAPVAEAGLIGAQARVWSIGGKLLASGGGQLLCRPLTPPR